MVLEGRVSIVWGHRRLGGRTSIRKGVKLRSSLVPMDRLTRAPAPSGVSMASKTLRIVRGVVFVAVKDGSWGGITGNPLKVDTAEGIVVFVDVAKDEFVELMMFLLQFVALKIYGRICCRW